MPAIHRLLARNARSLIARCAIVIVAASSLVGHSIALAQTASQTKTIYLSPKGSDSASGASADTAVATLQKAIDRAQGLLDQKEGRVEIAVGRGRYMNQVATLDSVKANKALTLRADCQGDTCAVFDGSNQGRWLSVKYAPGGGGTLEIRGLTIVDYLWGIVVSGSRDDTTHNVTHVSIVDNEFRRIGQPDPRAQFSTGAIVFINVDDSRIERNHFSDIRNKVQCVHLHGVYMAHGSSDNVIRSNTFERGCGDAIRLRDGSGNNKIAQNVFVDFWASAPVSEWYCESKSRDDCTKDTPECPSFGNVLSNNRMERKSLKPVPMTATFGADDKKACGGRPAGAKRFLDSAQR